MSDRTCNRCNQPLSSSQKKFCSHSCSNFSTATVRVNRNREVGWKPCDIEGCDKRARTMSAGLCAMHYHRVYRSGSLERMVISPKWVDIRGQRFGKLLVVERDTNAWLCACDCGRTAHVETGSLNRGALSCGARGCKPPPVPRQLDAGYGAAHSRVRRDNGPASNHICVDCGIPAYQWSYDHHDQDERISDERNSLGMPYSLDSRHYQPRCVNCHKTFDRTHGQRVA